jgi:hypothetical protein
MSFEVGVADLARILEDGDEVGLGMSFADYLQFLPDTTADYGFRAEVSGGPFTVSPTSPPTASIPSRSTATSGRAT